MASGYNVVSIHLKDGGRLPLLFANGSPFPVSLVCRYVIQTLWPRAFATNSILARVRAFADLYMWAAELAQNATVNWARLLAGARLPNGGV